MDDTGRMQYAETSADGASVGSRGGGGSHSASGIPYDAEPYPDWTAAQTFLRMAGRPQPFDLAQTADWVLMTSASVAAREPRIQMVRAECMNFTRDMFASMATRMCQMERRADGPDGRIRSTAALASLLCAGLAKGYACGSHCDSEGGVDKSGGGDAAPGDNGGAGGAGGAPSSKKKDAAFRPHSEYTFKYEEHSGSWPMFEFAYEELYDEQLVDVLAVRIWRFIYDESHSTSALMKRVMEDSQEQMAHMKRNGNARARATSVIAENARMQQWACGPQDIANDFERLVDMQYRSIYTVQAYISACRGYEGGTAENPRGCPLIQDWEERASLPGSKTKPEGCTQGFGSRSPIGLEYLLSPCRHSVNAHTETAGALTAGLCDLNGAELNICARQLACESYFARDSGRGGGAFVHFILPILVQSERLSVESHSIEEFFWVCADRSKVSPFQLSMPRPLAGVTRPTPALRNVVVDALRGRLGSDSDPSKESDAPDVDANGDVRMHSGECLCVSDEELFRSLATGKDERQEAQAARLQNDLVPFDSFLKGYSANSIESISANNSGDEYTIRIKSAIYTNAQETNNVWKKAVLVWFDHHRKRVEDAKAQICASSDAGDGGWNGEERAADEQVDLLWCHFHIIKKDLVKYHACMLGAVFQSSTQRKSVPRGHVAMFEGLMNGVAAHGGTAVMAFRDVQQCSMGAPGQETVGEGTQLQYVDRTVWGHLQDWLGGIFSEDLKVQGRDRLIVDELLLVLFETCTKTTWAFVLFSRRGSGKSMTVERFGYILPEGAVQFNAASSEKAGMNGNSSPNNACLLIYDETPSDITSPHASNRGEFWKQILTRRKYELERTMARKSSGGSDVHVTVKIETSHEEVHAIMTNLGPNITVGGLPSEPKIAFIQRTISMFARAQTHSGRPSADDEFYAHHANPEVKRRIAKFRLFVCLVWFVRLNIQNLDFLQPDLAYARLMWEELDKELFDDFNMSQPAPRRNAKRAENVVTFCVMEAVARCFLYKQTAYLYDCGACEPGGNAKPFEFGDIWDVVRTLHPSREIILYGWQYGFEYTVGTSMHGVNVMTSACEKAGITIGSCLRKSPHADAAKMADQVKGTCASEYQLHDLIGMEEGATLENISRAAQAMKTAREQRAAFRKVAKHTEHKAPLQAVRTLCKAQGWDDDKTKAATAALFPTVPAAAIFYREHSLVRWMNGTALDRATAIDCNAITGTDPDLGHRRQLRFHTQRLDGGGPKEVDLAWMVIDDTTDRQRASLSFAEKISTAGASTAEIVGMHKEGIADTLEQMMGEENIQRIMEMPNLPGSMHYSNAIEKTGTRETGITTIKMATFTAEKKTGGSIAIEPGKEDDEVSETCDARDSRSGQLYNYNDYAEHKSLDRLVNRGRLPALLAIGPTTNVRKGNPIRHTTDNGIEINTGRAFEHAMMISEMTLSLQEMPGIRDSQEMFDQGRAGPNGLQARGCAPSASDISANVRTLPYSRDLAQIFWSKHAYRRLYASDRKEAFTHANNQLKKWCECYSEIDANEFPEMTLRYPGYQATLSNSQGKRSALMPRLLSIEIGDTPCDDKPAVRLEDVSGAMAMNEAEIRLAAASALGRHASDDDIETHARLLAGANYTYEVKGDLFDHSTWFKHARASLSDRGFCDFNVNDVGTEVLLSGEWMLQERYWEAYSNAKLKARDGVCNDTALHPAHQMRISGFIDKHSTYRNVASSGKEGELQPPPRKRKASINLSMQRTMPRHPSQMSSYTARPGAFSIHDETVARMERSRGVEAASASREARPLGTSDAVVMDTRS